MKRFAFWGLCAAMALLAACRHTTSELVSGTGTMLVTGDCHAWHVKSDSGDYYELHNLSEEFQRRCGFRIIWPLISGYSGHFRWRAPVVCGLDVAGTIRRAA